MIIMRLLEREDYYTNYNEKYALGLNVKDIGAQFFQELWTDKKGGVLVAETEDGKVVGWFSFIDKFTARNYFWPSRKENDNMDRLVGVHFWVDLEYQGKEIDVVLAQELVDLAKEWDYHGVEVACQNEEESWHTSVPFKEAGFIEVEKVKFTEISSADFIIMEYTW